MRFLKYPAEGDGAFQIAPLVDIVFVVLVFFIVTSALREAEKEMAINPPSAENTTENSARPRQIVVNVDRDGTIVVYKKTYTMEQLVGILEDRKRYDPSVPVVIRADGQTAHQNVVNVMDACIAAGIEQMWFVTVDKEQ